MLDPFRTVPVEARSENLARYAEFLLRRDGTMDHEKQFLSYREEGIRRFETAPSRIRDIDRDLFKAQYASFDRTKETSAEMLLLLALVKVNGAEAYGVTRTYDKVLRRAMKNKDQCELTLLTEETYHTRLLLSASLAYGVEVSGAYEPPAALRALIATIGAVPASMARPLVLASEVLGILLFLNLLEKNREVLRHDPELRDGIEERLSEIITDELGHMSFNRALLGPVGMAEARMLLPVVAASMSGIFPELNVLGSMARASTDEVAGLVSGRRLPEQVARTAFIC
jgi:hypothetical protein